MSKAVLRTKLRLGDYGNHVDVVVVDTRDDRSQRARIRDNAPHAHYAIEREDIRAELTAFKAVCEFIGERQTWGVYEPFGGSGWHSAFIQKLVKPINHGIRDISVDCVQSIRESLRGSGAGVRVDDSFLTLAEMRDGRCSFDWVHADFNLWTLERLDEDERLRNAFNGVFGCARHLITFTDTSYYYITNEPDRQNHEFYMDKWLRAVFGWKIHATFNWGPAAMHVLGRDEPKLRQHSGGYRPMPITILETAETTESM